MRRVNPLDGAGHLLVRRALEREDEIAYALFDLLAPQQEWTPSEWQQWLREMSTDNRKIEEVNE